MGIRDWFKGKKSLQSVHTSGQNVWNSLTVQEPYSGAWQKNDELTRTELTASDAVFSCVSLISKDIGKLPIVLKTKVDGVLVHADIPEKLRVLKKPNNYQTWQQFQEQWTSSLLLRGNTYVWKLRDAFGEVYRMVVLNPDLVTPLIDKNGNVFYQLSKDCLTQAESEILPASEIIHDRINTFYHPLVGLSPIMACGVVAKMGVKILNNAANFFGNGSRPGGILVAPGPIAKEKAEEIQARWNQNYSGSNYGKTAVIGDGMTYTVLGMSAADSQMLELLEMSGRVVCSVFNVPPFKIGIGTVPDDPEKANGIYYSDCLQAFIESRENLIDEGLNLESFKVESFLDIDTLIRMDSERFHNMIREDVKGCILTPNEGRAKIGMLPVLGGDAIYMQQQNFSLEALSKRDSKDDPFGKSESSSQKTNDAQKSFESLYQGVFSVNENYQMGQFVTHKGSLWHCEKDHTGEFDHKNFKLCVKGAK
ncbi:portal protein [Acinetobacter baumannii]|uniref:phage portal protein n=1 Tax=Acinetobacter baumannii TaxID=470 RepID=UPI000DE73100|nr:phage portal protein [Acinetobacter baumannii]EHU2215476.1 phage portal protein [Acinetobacter baumannii]MBJ9487323.1 phage portal protein [Acinetobacter baumannii]SSR95349.1 portal protein [Acinetobacter baumannii]